MKGHNVSIAKLGLLSRLLNIIRDCYFFIIPSERRPLSQTVATSIRSLPPTMSEREISYRFEVGFRSKRKKIKLGKHHISIPKTNSYFPIIRPENSAGKSHATPSYKNLVSGGKKQVKHLFPDKQVYSLTKLPARAPTPKTRGGYFHALALWLWLQESAASVYNSGEHVPNGGLYSGKSLERGKGKTEGRPETM